MKQFLVFQGPVSSRSGYGDHARDLLNSLIAMDKFDIKVVDLRWGDCPRNGISEKDKHLEKYFSGPQGITKQPDVFIQLSVPNEFNPIGKFNVGITAGIETTICDASWIQGCNRMNLIIVPSNHAKNVFDNTTYDQVDNKTKQKTAELKCTTPIEVLFEGADLDIFHKTAKISNEINEELKKIPEKFCFLFVGHWLNGAHGHDRKDVGKLIETFIHTFKNNPSTTRPALILKTSSATFSVIDRNQMQERINNIVKKSELKNPPKIYLLHGDLTEIEMNELYNHPKVKAHVSFTKGEGFGRPLLEASLSGKPVIAPNWSGHIDFLKHSTLLPGDLKQVHQSVHWKNVILPESKWFYVNLIYASKVIKDVFKNYKNYLNSAKNQLTYSKNEFSTDKMTSVFADIMKQHVNVPQEVKIALPKMNKISLPKLKKVKL